LTRRGDFLSLVFGIGEVAVEGGVVVGDPGINLAVEMFDIPSTGGGERERCVELGQVSGFDGDVEFTEGGESESELATGDSVGFDCLVLDVVVEPVCDGGDEFAVGCTRGDVNPDFVQVHIFIVVWNEPLPALLGPPLDLVGSWLFPSVGKVTC
jgi:hypothetical protein